MMAIPLIGKVLSKVLGLADKAIPDKDQREAFKHEATMALINSDLAQLEVNKAEAQHKSIFVAGWRPAVGWTCAAGLAYNFVLQPLAGTIMVYVDPSFDATALPTLEISELMTILGGMLGFGTMRTVEKIRGVQTNSVKDKNNAE